MLAGRQRLANSVRRSSALLPQDPRDLFLLPAPDLARHLIGARFEVGETGGVLVETEAYTREDPASHSFRGPSARNRSMFGPPGRLYVYRSYGIHWCVNVVCGAPGSGQAVLLRALQPDTGIPRMEERRGVRRMLDLCRGPGRLAQAMGIDLSLDGHPIGEGDVALVFPPTPRAVATGQRIGISKGVERPWRFVLAGSPYASPPRLG